MGPAGDKTNRLIEYLLRVCPSSFEAKTDQGYTPLFLACLLGRVQFAKTLIDAGADQSVKDNGLNNIIHASLTNKPEPARLRELLNLFDPDLRSHLFRQRNNLSRGGETPLHFWLKTANPISYTWDYHSYPAGSRLDDENISNIEILNVILEYSGGAELEIFNSSGDTVLHSAVILHLPEHAGVLLAKKPELLYRENAVGRTPGEIAYDLFIRSKVDGLDSIAIPNDNTSSATKLEKRSPETFLHTEPQRSGKKRKERTWQITGEYLAKVGGKRRLVSLNEANDVAKRLGDKYVWQRYFSRAMTSDEARAAEQQPHEAMERNLVEDQYQMRKNMAWKSDEDAVHVSRPFTDRFGRRFQLGSRHNHRY